jgi:hypothetical protein
MHRVDQALAHDRSRNHGYVADNVVLLCAACHDVREGERRA